MDSRKLNDIRAVVTKTGQNPVTGNIYDLVQVWKSWYRGNVNDFHRFTYKSVTGKTKTGEKLTFGIPKKIGEDWVSLLWNENVTIKTSIDAYNDRLDEVFKQNKLRVELGNLLEKAFGYAGWCATVEYLIDGETVIDYITSEYAIITEGKGITAKGIVTINEIEQEDSYITHLTMHSLIDGKYVVEHKAYKSKKLSELGSHSQQALLAIFKEEELMEMRTEILDDEGRIVDVKYIVEYDTDIATFQVYKPNITNNFDTSGKEGIPVTANSIDAFKSLDEAFTSLWNETRNNKTVTVFSDKATRKKTVQDPESGEQQYVQYIDDDNTQFISSPMNETEDWVKRFKGEFNADPYIATINRDLSWISFKVGLGTGFYSFDGTNTYVNEKQIISTNNDTWKNKVKHEIVLRDAIEGLVKAVIYLEQSQGRLPVMKYDISIKFDDSIIQDDETKKENSLKLVELGMKPEWKHLIEWEGLTETEAKEQIKQSTGVSIVKLKTISDAVNLGVMSLEQAQTLMYGEIKTPEELKLMYIQTLVEKGIPLTPEQLTTYNGGNMQTEEVIINNNEEQENPEIDSPEKENVEDILLNGAQIASAVSIVDSFNSGVLSYEGALEMLVTFLNIPIDKARIMLNNGVLKKEIVSE